MRNKREVQSYRKCLGVKFYNENFNFKQISQHTDIFKRQIVFV